MSLIKETQRKYERKTNREPSTSIKVKREDSKDRRAIVVEEKQSKSKPSPVTFKKLLEKQSSSDKKITEKNILEKDRKVPKHEPGKVQKTLPNEEKKGRESKINKDLLEKKLTKKKIDSIEEKDGKVKKRSSQADVGEKKTKSRRDRTRTRTLSPTEVKQLIPSKLAYEMSSGDVGKQTEKIRKEEEFDKEEEVEEYEEDFENYESDFEDAEPTELEETSLVQSTEFSEERQHHSPSPSLPNVITPPQEEEKWKLEVQRRQIQAIKNSLQKENYEIQRRKLTSKSEDDSDKENAAKVRRKSDHIIDFSKAVRKQKKEKKAVASRKRGQELLSMISLDSVTYSILEIPPTSYDEYMKTFGKTNTKQVHVQTHEDDLDEEVQTEEIHSANKWTQNPPEYFGSRKIESEFSYVLSKEERLGVGGDSVAEEDEMRVQTKTNGIWNFLSWSSQVVLSVLERKSGNFLNLDDMPQHSKAMAFGDGFVQLNMSEIPFIKGKSVTRLAVSSKFTTKLLSVHVSREKSFQKSFICIWNFRLLSKPLKILVASNRITSCAFDHLQGNLVFAGLSDGTILLWDLRESSVIHRKTTRNSDWTLQSPTYTTAGSLREEGHFGSVVAVRTVGRLDGVSGDFAPMQICSLDEKGIMIVWSVVQLENIQKSGPNEDLGLAHWGRVKLVKSFSFSVFANIKEEIPELYITCNDFVINKAEEDCIYIANSFGSVNHCSSYGTLKKPKFYVPAKQNAIIETTCLEMCPFNENYFLVGCGDGTIRLHFRHQENPLICLKANVREKEKEAAVVCLSWMPSRPCMFFALDSMSRIHVWDIGVSDMYPEISISLAEKKISCMKLLPVFGPNQIPYIVLGTEGGSVEVHRLKKEFFCRSQLEIQNEMKMFLKYVSIL